MSGQRQNENREDQEQLKLSLERRDKIHMLIQNSLESMLQEKVTDILNNYRKSDFEKIKAINAAIDEMNDISERFDRRMHGGKTESEMRKERIDQSSKLLDDIFKTNGTFGKDSFDFSTIRGR